MAGCGVTAADVLALPARLHIFGGKKTYPLYFSRFIISCFQFLVIYCIIIWILYREIILKTSERALLLDIHDA